MSGKASFLRSWKEDLVSLLALTLEREGKKLIEVSKRCVECMKKGGKLLIFGNGGSAADAQHIAAEFVNRFRLERTPLPAIALTTDTSILTSIGNDYHFDEIFSKQVMALARAGDMALGISTSGTSANVIKALDVARTIGIFTVLLAGEGGMRHSEKYDVVISVPSSDTPRIQEVHLFLEHAFCDLVERSYFGEE